ncbi:MAG TPA: amino acid adenylation domain-containing protein [Acetobacteraceae bacterium]|nr:amino acid adenylation domain-containing protein [Acetobacteraceae bacterium]
MTSLDDFLAELRRDGIHVWADGTELRCRAPKGRLTRELRAELAVRKAEILQSLGSLPDLSAETGEHIPRADRAGDLPLSSAQRRLWFLDQYETDKSVYAIATAVRLRGDLNIGALREAINAIVERHETLRTVFPVTDGVPLQRILPPFPVEIPISDLSAAGGTEPLEQLRVPIAEEMARQFDLAAGPLLRVRSFRLVADDHVLLLITHHIISDAWSVGVFVRELSEHYSAICSQHEPALPRLEIQYADFAAWQNAWLGSPAYNNQLEYWRRQLQSAPPLLELPWDRPRPAVRSHRGRVAAFQFTEKLTLQLKEFSRRNGVSLFMTLLTGFSALLARYSGQSEVVVGTPVANRNRAQLEPLIGFFVNTLALRVELADDPGLADLAARIKEVVLDAFSNQDIPFEDLVEKLRPERSLGYTPIFQVMLVLQNAPIGELSLPRLTISSLDMPRETAKFDVTVLVEDDGDSLAVAFEYSADLFDHDTIVRMAGHFENLLDAMARSPDTCVSEADFLGPEEARMLLQIPNAAAIGPPPEGCIHTLFEHRAAERPQAVALMFQDQRLTYGELNARSNQLAHHLIALGVKPEIRVAIALERGLEMVVAVLATLKAGGAYVPLDPAYPAERLALVIADSTPRVLLSQEHVLPGLGRLPDGLTVVTLGAGACDFATLPDTNPLPAASGLTSANLAYVLYTSGSTGTPKGVMVEHANVVRLFSSTEALFRFKSDDVWTLFHSYAFDFSVWELWGALIYGGRLIVVPQFLARSPRDFYRLLRDQGVSVLNQTPSAFRQLIAALPDGMPSRHRLRYVILGGEALEPASLRPWYARNDAGKTRLVNMYGITETTVHVTFCPLEPSDVPHRERSPIGVPLRDLHVYLLDRHRAPVPIGVAGEIYVGGAGVARGYLNRPELTAERFLPDPFIRGEAHAGARMYRSGDLGRRLPNGTLEFLGRNDQQVKIRGFRIELGEIEARLAEYPGVAEAVVLAREDEPGERRLVAYFTAALAIESGDLRSHLARTLPDYMVPAAFVCLDALPLTANGKLDQRALPVPGWSAFGNRGNEPPEGAVEAALAAVWADLLRVNRVGRRDNFFELGGHSLLAVQMVSRVRDRCDLELTVRQIFEAPTVAGLAALLEARPQDARRRSHLPPIRRVQHDVPLPLSYAQERLWFLDQLEPGNAFYNIPFAFRCKGLLDAAALERAINEIVRRHAALRTTFDQVDGRPYQQISGNVRIALARRTLSHLAAEEREAEALRLAHDEALTPFSLSEGPLVRACLIALAEDDHVLLLTIHHIVADGWSMGVLVREFSQIYPAFVRGEQSPLPALDIQFADFAVWQRAWLNGDALEAEIAYWLRQLQGAPQILELPADFPRPAVQTFRGATQPFRLRSSATECLKRLSQEADASLFMTLFAAFAVLLRRYSGETEILIGTPIANRDLDAIEPLIGFFVNTLALRADLSDDPTFPELVARVRQTILDAYAHPDVPFELVVERLQPARDMRRNPLVQVSLVFQNAPFSVCPVEGLELSRMRTDTGTARFDIEVFLWEEAGALQGEFGYYTDLFEADTIARLAGHFETLLTAIADDPNRPISALPLLTDQQRRELLIDRNATTAVFPRNTCVHRLFEEQASNFPSEIAVVHGTHSLTYRQLDARANQLARHLIGRGAGPGVLVGICLQRSLDLVVGILGILKAGAAYVPLDASYPHDRLAFMIDDARLEILLTHSELRTRLPDRAPAAIDLGRDWETIARQSPANTAAKVGPDDLAYVIYTSGSTGRPKGAMLEHRNVVNYLCWAREHYAVAAGSGAPVNSSISFDATVTSLLSPLVAGRRVELLPEQDEIEQLCAVLQSQRDYSLVKITPAHLDMLSRLLPAKPLERSTRAFVIGGEALTADHIAFWRRYAPDIRLINEYGPTETVVGCCIYEVPRNGTMQRNVPIGRPIANTRLYVFDEHLQPVPVGVPGELFIGGAGVGRGYLHREGLTAERFIDDPFSRQPRARLYKTGDRARYLADGTLEFLGRLDTQLKLRGYRVEAEEVERVLAEHPAVDQVMVVLRRDQPGDDRLVAYIVARIEPDAGATADQPPAARIGHEHVLQWQQVFQDSYAGSQDPHDIAPDFAGWSSSYTDALIPIEEMREWLDRTVQRIRSLDPGRVWEIGCGTGLLLARLAPHAESYLGTDFSEVALRRVQRMIERNPDLCTARLLRRAAHDCTDVAGPFDTIVINSVIQYFPGVDYLLGVLDQAVQRLAPGGRIFLGDVRNLGQLEQFQASVEAFRAPDTRSVEEIRRAVRERMSREEELLLDPQLFLALQSRYPGLTDAAVALKRGWHRNEMLRFRFDVTLHFGVTAAEPAGVAWQDWDACRFSLNDLRDSLERGQPDVFALRGVPNARLSRDVALLQELRASPGTLPALQLRRRLHAAGIVGLDPEDLWSLGDELGYRVDIGASGEHSRFDVIYRRLAQQKPPAGPAALRRFEGPSRPWQHYANDPLRGRRVQRFAQELRALAEAKLPGYMVPSNFVALEEFPLTSNGKVDRNALPAPSGRPAGSTFTAPVTPEEEVLASIWSEVLGINRVGTQDDFFALGGHSLLATQVISRAREAFAVELQVRTIFEAPTIAILAQRVALLRAAANDAAPEPAIEQQPRNEQSPLSFAQERLWLLDRLEEKSPAYNIASSVRLAGSLDMEALRHGFRMLIARHEVLRTTFVATSEGEPVQHIAASMDFELPLIDVEACDEPSQSARIQELSMDVHQRVFDLQRGPLLRAVVLRRAAREHVLLVCMHHIVSDGWSIGVMTREIAEFYAACVERRTPRLDPLPLQYADYAIWQRNWLRGEVLQSQTDYWKAHLAGAPPVLELPADFPRLPVQSFRGDMELFALDHALTAALEALSRRHGVSLYMTLLSAFAVLLFRYSRQTDLVIGSPVAGRRYRKLEPLIGFFVNTLTLRVDLAGDPEFSELLARVRTCTLDAYAHQDVPFEYLVEQLHPLRSLSHAPVFQVMFVLLNTPLARIEVPDLTLTPIDSSTATAKFDLTLCMGPGEDGMWGWFEYRTDLFESATVRRMVGHFTTLLKAIVADPASPMGRLPMLTDAEREPITADQRQAGGPAPPFVAVTQLFEQQAEATPDRVAVAFDGAALTYRALNSRANALAHRLIASGIGPHARVGICMERGFDMVAGVLAVLKLGGAYVPLDPHYPRERLAFMCNDAQLDALLTERTLQATIPRPSAQVIAVDDAAGAAHAGHAGNPNVLLDPNNLAYIIYTSGSSGEPKGIAMRHGALANLIGWQVASDAEFGPARTLQFTSLSFDVSFQETFSTWCSGGQLVLVDDTTRRDARTLVRYLAEHRIERLFLPFIALQQLALVASEPQIAALALRDIITAGERLRITPELADFMRGLPRCRLHNHYGPAETHVVTAFTLGPEVADWPELPPIGRPVANTQVYLLDEHRQPVPQGVIGEIYLGGACLARGYWQRPALTQQRFVAHPLATGRDARLYRTGDLGRRLNDGNIQFLGRCDDQVKIRGFRVEPGEIEAVLAKSPAVSDVVVIAREDSPGDRRLVTYVVPQPGHAIDEGALREFVRASLPDYMIPAAFVTMAAFPQTPSGKADRLRLPAPGSTAGRGSMYNPPRNPDELRLTEIWESVLDRPDIGISDDFFELGGHSLLAVRVMARIERAWGVHLPLAVLFQYPTIELLAGRLRERPMPAVSRPLVPIRRTGTLPPFFMVPGAGGNVLYLYDLARRLGPDQPFYGLQAIGLDGQAAPPATVEEMAEQCVRDIIAVCPAGPFMIGGHSFGGAIAFEIAQQLQRAGYSVALLVAFDTNAPHTVQPAPQQRPDDAAWLAEIGSIIGELSGKEVVISETELRCLDAEDQVASFRSSLIRNGWLPPETTLTQVHAFVEVYKAHIRMEYRPRAPVPIPILLLKTLRTPGPDARDPTLDEVLGPAWGWNDLALGEMDIATVPGNHLTMMTEPHVQAVADQLRQRLVRCRQHSP